MLEVQKNRICREKIYFISLISVAGKKKKDKLLNSYPFFMPMAEIANALS